MDLGERIVGVVVEDMSYKGHEVQSLLLLYMLYMSSIFAVS